MKISRAEQILNYVILAIFAVLILWPLVMIVYRALGGETGGIRLANFSDAWVQGRFSHYLLNSVLVTVVTVVVSLVVAVPAGYALGTMKFKGATIIFYIFLLGIMIPTEAFIVPLFYDMKSWGLTDTLWGVALPQIAMSIAFGVYWMRTYFKTANPSLSEAAKIDGAGVLRTLWSIQLPVARPALSTLTVLWCVWTWNDFMVPLIMSPMGDYRTAPLGLNFFVGAHSTNTTLQSAAAILVALPMVIVFLFLQKQFIKGMTDGAVKD
jgi:raffinose/stachyose/melibiose transport system permease protein